MVDKNNDSHKLKSYATDNIDNCVTTINGELY